MAKALVLFQLSILLLSSFTLVSNAQLGWYPLYKNVDHLSPAQAPKPHKGHHPHPHPHPISSPASSPVYAPTKPPTKAPIKPPAKAPAKPPVKPPTPSPSPSPYYPSRKPVAVRGLVYCKPCKFRGIETLYQSKPLQGNFFMNILFFFKKKILLVIWSWIIFVSREHLCMVELGTKFHDEMFRLRGCCVSTLVVVLINSHIMN